MAEELDVVIIGAGQAGLSISWELTRAGREHVILERGLAGQSWRGRWDSFTLVLPNWTVQLPGYSYQGHDPDGFMSRDEIVDHLSLYAESFGAPVRNGVEVTHLRHDGIRFRLETSHGPITAREVVVATGAYQKPHRPAGLNGTEVITSDAYTNPAALPSGRVLVVGSGQSGCQIAEDLHLAGREVILACGRAPWQPRRIEDKDIASWVLDSPLMKMTVDDLPSPMARLGANPQATGRDGGHDLHYRILQKCGVTLAGHLLGVEDGTVHFANDLADSVAFGDARYDDLRHLVAGVARARGVPAPEMPPAEPFVHTAPGRVALRDIAAIVLTSGYRPDYRRWIVHPEAFDDIGFPIQANGSSTVIPGLHFMGVHFQRCRASATLIGVAADAAALAERMVTEASLA